MVTCEKCIRRFPSHLVDEIVIGGHGYVDPVRRKVCPVCALALSNDATGQSRAAFDGPRAQKMLEEAKAFLAR